MPSKHALLDQIRADILDHNICPDLAKQAKNLVMGDGNPDATIVFIGEAPGKKEDEQGLPFIGAAGKFLDTMLASISLDRQDVYITNIVKYRPPDNRDPLSEEKQAFLPYLLRQLAVIEPSIVVTLGRHSMEYFLPKAKIGQIHGVPQEVHLDLMHEGSQHGDEVQGTSEEQTEPYEGTVKGVPELVTQQFAPKPSRATGSAGRPDGQVLAVLPLFHPAAALYNGRLRQTLLDDFAKLPLIINEMENSNTPNRKA